ncbi:MAG: hypothetical protein JWQ76_5761 [Ramlibacter sp.]|nr:hypothetical protein [Ramlibacter sp.]
MDGDLTLEQLALGEAHDAGRRVCEGVGEPEGDAETVGLAGVKDLVPLGGEDHGRATGAPAST